MSQSNDWEEQADAYLAYFEDNPDRISATRVFPRLVEHFGDLHGLRVLDFGCGQGRFARILADAGGEVTAFDTSAAEIANARALDQGRGIRYIDRQQELLAAAPFDRILCFMVLLCNDAEGADALLRMLFASAAPGALLGLANTDTTTLGRQFPDFHSTPPAHPNRGAAYLSYIPTSAGVMQVTDHYFSPDHLRQMLADAGFELRAEERVAEPFILHIAAPSQY